MAEHKKPIIRTMTDKFTAWCADKSDSARVERTMAQAVIIGVTDFVATLNGLPPWASALITLIGMPLLSIVQAEIGKASGGNG